jgi:DNA polymerase III subunit epsilon
LQPEREQMLLIYDTETSGLWKDGLDVSHEAQPKICQLSALLVSYEGETVGELDRIVKPNGWTIPQAASNIHGITTERALAEGLPLFEVLKEFSQLVAKADRLVGHNEAFDFKVVNHGLKLIKRSIKFPEKRSCTMLMAMNTVKLPSKYPKPDQPYAWPSLSVTYKHLFGRDLEGAHNSAVDVQACMEVYRELKNRGVDDVDPVRSRSGMRASDWAAVGRTPERLQELLKTANDYIDDLSDWEQDFVTDLAAKVSQYGDKTFMSDKQWGVLERIERKVLD